MNSIITTADVTVNYIEVTRQHEAAPLRRKTTGRSPAIGDRVNYTSKAGNLSEYRVFWIGSTERNGEVIERLGIRKAGAPKYIKGFFVDAASCEFIRPGR